MGFARWVFRVAAVYGLLALAPQYFLEGKIGADTPPAITHPEFFYGFLGVALAWQVAFLVIASDPPRYRLLMPVAVLEKFSFGGAVLVLYTAERVSGLVLTFAVLDLVLGVLFAVAFFLCPSASQGTGR